MQSHFFKTTPEVSAEENSDVSQSKANSTPQSGQETKEPSWNWKPYPWQSPEEQAESKEQMIKDGCTKVGTLEVHGNTFLHCAKW